MKSSQKVTETPSSSPVNMTQPMAGGKTRRIGNVILMLLTVATLVTVVLPLLALAWLVRTSGNGTDSGAEVILLLPPLFCGLFVTLFDVLYVPLYMIRHKPRGVYLIISGFILLASVVYIVAVERFLR